MKIITEKAAYVQKNDIVYLTRSDLIIPPSIMMKVFGKGAIIDDSNRNEFVEFTEINEIEFLKSIDWIVDYNEFKELSEKKLIELIEKINEEKDLIEANCDPKQNMKVLQLDFKICSLRSILRIKQGDTKIILPDGINRTKKDNSIKKLVKTLIKKEHQN